MSDEQDRSVRRVKFSGDQDDWRVWQAQFMALAYHKGYQEVLTGEVECPPAAKKLVAGKDDAEDLLIKARRMNGAAYSALVLSSVDDVFFNAVDEAKTSALPNGMRSQLGITCWTGMSRKRLWLKSNFVESSQGVS